MSFSAAARAVALLCFSLGLVASATAQNVEDFYKGKTLQYLIGYSPGGTDDVWARLIAKYLPLHLPGKPNAVANNVPGAGSMLLANQLYNTQPKDGTIFGGFNRGIPFEALLGDPAARFDPRKFNYLGSPDVDVLACVVRNDAPVQKLEQLRDTQLVVGGTGAGADSQTYPDVFANLLGLKIKLVQGYPGSRDILLAVERGEVQGGCVSYDTVARDSYFRSGKSHILFQAAPKPDPRIDAPSVVDLATDEAHRQALDFFLLRQQMGRPIAAPPNVPPARVEALQAAFKAALDDPDLKAEAEKANINPRYTSPAELLAVIDKAYATSPEIVALTKKAMGR